mmetsp:Transcript_44751/g.115091  ORF Transcript_44751/g.115091 Transcript_44751/m.115091 type:complete len:110 (+) Transcript_44751:72-401(+)
MASRSASSLLAAVFVALALFAGSTAFLPQPPVPRELSSNAAAAATAGATAAAASSVLPAFAAEVQQQLLEGSTVSVAWQPWENPGIVWIFLMASFTMSIALVVWGRNGF